MMSKSKNQNPLEISDEDFLNSPMPDYEEEEEQPTSEEETTEEDDSEDFQETDDSEEETDTTEQQEENEDTDEDEDSGESEDEPEGEDEETQEEDDSEADNDQEEKEKSEEEKETTESEEEDETSLSDAKEQLKKLFSPFTANGKEMKIDSVEDAIQLMQMGANYSKKMAALKPSLRILKMLENNDLLDESKLSFYIDIEQGNKEALTKLIKDKGVDPLEIDLDRSDEYKPSTYNVSDNEVVLDTILAEIRDTSSYRRTIDIVSNKWDDSSKKFIYQNPQLIKVINDHVADGTYDQITTEMEKQRMLGRLDGLTDLQAYKVIGDSLFAENDQQQKPSANAGRVVERSNQPKAKDDSKLKSRKKAAGSPKAAPSSKKNDDDFNPLSASDEEFEKIMANRYR